MSVAGAGAVGRERRAADGMITTPLDGAGGQAGPRGRDATGPLPAACLVHAAVAPGSAVRRKGSDLAAYRAGQIDRDEAKRRVQIREF